jgi:RNA polymerase sigma-70 factor, ECF subfamily
MDRAADHGAASAVDLAYSRDSPPQPRQEPGRRSRGGAPVTDLADAVRRAQDGDEDAFRVLYRDLQPRMLRYLRAMVGDDADDVASETWLHVARGLKTFHGDSDGFRGWTATIARNRATDHLRHHQRRVTAVTVPVDQLTGLPGTDDTADTALEGISTDAAIALIARLPRDQAEAVLLRAVMGLDAETAGKVLGKRAGAVRTAAHRGLRKLAGFLGE